MAGEIEVAMFHPRHLEVAELREHERELLNGIADIEKQLGTLMRNSRVALTFMYGGRVITCAGFVEMWPGVAELWQIPTVHVEKCKLTFAKTLKKYTEGAAKDFGYHRLQTSCPVDPLHDRWMEFLGFTKEGTMKQYTYLKQDYSIFGRVFTWAS